MKRLWQGNANAWECDELGHMNVMPYVTKALSALGFLSDSIGMKSAFGSQATASVTIQSMQVRYLAEAREGAPLHIEGGIEKFTETDATVCLLMKHSFSERSAASFRILVQHIEPSTRRVFAWPKRISENLDAHLVPSPDENQARGLQFSASRGPITMQKGEQLGLKQIGMGQFHPQDMDVFGYLRADQFVGRVSDSVIHYREVFPEEVDAHDHANGTEGLGFGGVLLEANLHIHSLPRAGQSYVIRSGLAGVTENVRHLVHWGFEPVTGTALWSMEGIAGMMDLKARKLIKLDPDRLQDIRVHVIPDLTA